MDEIHRLNPTVEETLYPAMEDYKLDLILGQGPSAQTYKLTLPHFTLIGATTRAGLLTSPLRDRFGVVLRLDFYTEADLVQIVIRSARILNVGLTADGAVELARRSRGTPRIANRLLRRVRDFAQVLGDGTIDQRVAHDALNRLNVDERGFDEMDRRILQTIIEKFAGGPVGIETLAVAVSEERDTIEDVYEPFLIQLGFLARTPRGRVATRLAYAHFGLVPPPAPGGTVVRRTMTHGPVAHGRGSQPTGPSMVVGLAVAPALPRRRLAACEGFALGRARRHRHSALELLLSPDGSDQRPAQPAMIGGRVGQPDMRRLRSLAHGAPVRRPRCSWHRGRDRPRAPHGRPAGRHRRQRRAAHPRRTPPAGASWHSGTGGGFRLTPQRGAVRARERESPGVIAWPADGAVLTLDGQPFRGRLDVDG